MQNKDLDSEISFCEQVKVFQIWKKTFRAKKNFKVGNKFFRIYNFFL